MLPAGSARSDCWVGDPHPPNNFAVTNLKSISLYEAQWFLSLWTEQAATGRQAIGNGGRHETSSHSLATAKREKSFFWILHTVNVQAYLGSTHIHCSQSTLTGATAASGPFFKFFMLATRVWYMQSFVYPHRKKSKDAIFGDLVVERWYQHDQSITLGNVKRCMNNCDMLIKNCTHKVWYGGVPSCWKNTAGCRPSNYTWIKVFQHIQVTGRCHSYSGMFQISCSRSHHTLTLGLSLMCPTVA